jgi:hypothetical protein
MPNDVRDLPAGRNDGLYRFLGGSPLTVAFRLILLSILVGAGIVIPVWLLSRLFGAPRGR